MPDLQISPSTEKKKKKRYLADFSSSGRVQKMEFQPWSCSSLLLLQSSHLQQRFGSGRRTADLKAEIQRLHIVRNTLR